MLPFKLACALTLPLIDGQPSVTLPFTFVGQFKERALFDESFTGAGTLNIPMSLIGAPGAVLIVIEHVAVADAAPILVKYNGANEGKELAPGSGDLYVNLAPSAGVTSISFTYTTPGRVRAWILGG
jgi:hypothetical protein